MYEEIKRLNVGIPASIHTELKVKAAIQGKTIAQLVLEAINEKLEKEKNKGK